MLSTMPSHNAQQEWETYRQREMRRAAPLLKRLGFELDDEQPHTGGERFLMAGKRDVGGGGYKLVLVGKRTTDHKRVVIKISSDREGIREIATERSAREVLRVLKFAYQTLHAPGEVLYITGGNHTVFATAHIEQPRTFLSRPIEEQFSLALQAFKAQESVHATTYSHAKAIRNIFGIWGAQEYLNSFEAFLAAALRSDPHNHPLAQSLEKAHAFLAEHRNTIEQYCGFLTHADFVPHNLRVHEGNVYVLDAASLHFGNKYESWARFLNFMLLYNRPLEKALLQYVHDNRTPEEELSLRLMRIYKLGKLLEYHAGTLPKTSGDLNLLGEKRVEFWREALESLLDDRPLPKEIIAQYESERDSLRSEEEKKRQEALH